jgi:hypothetical protein
MKDLLFFFLQAKGILIKDCSDSAQVSLDLWLQVPKADADLQGTTASVCSFLVVLKIL